MNVFMSWEGLWLYYGRSSESIQSDILRQVDLKDFLPNIPVDARREVMRHAPAELQQQIGNILPLTRKDERYQAEILRIFNLR